MNTTYELKNLNKNTINKLILFNAILSVIFYCIFIRNVRTIHGTMTPYLYLSAIPFSLIICRLFLLINREVDEDDLMNIIKRDEITKYLILVYIFVSAALILL